MKFLCFFAQNYCHPELDSGSNCVVYSAGWIASQNPTASGPPPF